jgi:hypothetical protein
MGFASRYIPIGAPLLAVLYITWIVYGPRRIGALVQVALCLGPCLSLPSSSHIGLQIGAERRAVVRQVEQGLKHGVPGTRLVASVGARLYPDTRVMYERFLLLKAARIGRFGRFRDDAHRAPASAATVIGSRDSQRGPSRATR